jgi:hypothetical protein
MKSDPPEFLETKEVAELLRISPRTVEGLRLADKGPRYFKVGPGKRAHVIYKRVDVISWLEQFGSPGSP